MNKIDNVILAVMCDTLREIVASIVVAQAGCNFFTNYPTKENRDRAYNHLVNLFTVLRANKELFKSAMDIVSEIIGDVRCSKTGEDEPVQLVIDEASDDSDKETRK